MALVGSACLRAYRGLRADSAPSHTVRFPAMTLWTATSRLAEAGRAELYHHACRVGHPQGSIEIATAGVAEGRVRHVGGIGGDLPTLDAALARLRCPVAGMQVVHEEGPCGYTTIANGHGVAMSEVLGGSAVRSLDESDPVTRLGLLLAHQFDDDITCPALPTVPVITFVPQHAYGKARYGERALDDFERIAAMTRQPFRHQSYKMGASNNFRHRQERRRGQNDIALVA